MLLFFACESGQTPTDPPATGSGASIIGRWKISPKDRPFNLNVEVLDFQKNDSLYFNVDNDEDGAIDIIVPRGYQLKTYLEKEAIFLRLGNYQYEWAYPQFKKDTLLLDMIRVDTPRIAHYIKIE